MRQRSVRLTTDDICAGTVLWLRKDAGTVDPCGFAKSGLPLSALSHPCMVVDLLQGADSESDLENILICTMSSRFKSWRSDIPLVTRRDSPSSSSTGANYSGGGSDSSPRPYSKKEILTFARPEASMPKASFVATFRVFEVSLRMLRPFCKSPGVDMYQLDERSLKILSARTAQAIDEHRKERYLSGDALPLLGSDTEAEEEVWLIEFSDSEEEISREIPRKTFQREAAEAIDGAIKSWVGLGVQGDEVLGHLRLARQEALAYSRGMAATAS